MSQPEVQKNLLFRPWEEQKSPLDDCKGSRHSLSGQRCTVPPDTHISNQIKPLSQLDSQQSEVVATKHIRLIQEFKKSPRDSLSGSLWINTLLHSYIARINTAVTETDKIQVITQTRQLLRTYLQMSLRETQVESSAGIQSVKKENGSKHLSHDGNPLQENVTPKYQIPQKQLTDMNKSPFTPSGSSRLLPPTTPDSGYKSPMEFTPGMISATNARLVTPDFYGSSLKSNTMKHQQQLYTSPLLTHEQIHTPNIASRTALEEWYLENKDCPYATESIAEDLAAHSGLSKGQVLKWLSNRRNKDGNTKKSAGRRRKNELNRAKPYAPKRLPQLHLEF